MKLLILGHGRHGKDTVGEMLGIKYASSSRAALDAIYPCLSYILNETNQEMLFETRGQHRELWRLLINLYNTPDKSALTRFILTHNDVYVGMRSLDEFEASYMLFDKILWVDRSRHVGFDESMQIGFDPNKMIWVDNNGTLEDLRCELTTIISTL